MRAALKPNTRGPICVCLPPLLFASLGRAMSSQWLLGYGMYLKAWFKTLIHPSQIWQLFKHYCLNGCRCSFSSCLVGRSVSLEGGKWAFFSSFFFFFFPDTYFIFMFVSRTAKRCIWSPNQESHTPPSNSQLSKHVSLWSLLKQAIGRAHWADDPHLVEKKESLTQQCQEEWHRWHFSWCAPPLLFCATHFLINIFSS